MNLRFWLQHPHLLWPRLRFWIFERLNRDKPWLCTGTIEYLDRVLRPEMIGVEFGSGRSTHWLSKRLKHLLSVEHHREWHQSIAAQLGQAEVKNVDYRLIPLDHPLEEPERDRYDPLPAYAAVLDEYEDASIDFVLVDGHYRTTCIRAAISKIRPGGYLAVDDAERWDAVGGPPIPTGWICSNQSTNGIKAAKVWQRPRTRS